MRSDPLIYTVVVEDAYSAWENYTQSISLSVFCTHFIYSSPIAKYCPTEGEWEQTWDKDSVSLTCSFGLGHRVRTCNGTEWLEEQSDCNAVLVFLSTSLAGVLIVLVLFIVLCIRCRRRRQSKEDKEEGIEIPPLPANPKPATALSQTPEEAPSTSVETSSTPEAAVNGVNALEGAEGTEGAEVPARQAWMVDDDLSSMGQSDDDAASSSATPATSSVPSAAMPATTSAVPSAAPSGGMQGLALGGFGLMTGTAATVEYALPPPLPQKRFLFYLCSCRAVQAFCRSPLFVNFFKIILNCPCILGAGGILLSGVNS